MKEEFKKSIKKEVWKAEKMGVKNPIYFVSRNENLFCMVMGDQSKDLAQLISEIPKLLNDDNKIERSDLVKKSKANRK